jgi:glutathionylspermidine amidase/synthetase
MSSIFKTNKTIIQIIFVTLLCLSLVLSVNDKEFNNKVQLNKIDPNPDIAKIIPESCKKDCSTEFNTVLGENSNVIGFSNCNAYYCSNFDDGPVMIKKEALGTKEDIFSGIRWQCVEYARRWLIINKRFTFEGVDSAYQIWDINTVSRIDDDKKSKFASYKNDSGVPPKLGDLIIFRNNSQNPHGHVAVIFDSDLEKGYIDVAEQNNFNTKWETKTYARRIKLFTKNKESNPQYYLTEVSYSEHNSKCSLENDFNCHLGNFEINDNLIIGWKRIED